jgi:hypothetical protein
VVVGHDQAIGGNELARTAIIKANGGLLDVLEPIVRGFEAVFALQERIRRPIKQPHAFIGLQGSDEPDDERDTENGRKRAGSQELRHINTTVHEE